jgi:hypothetical protein
MSDLVAIGYLDEETSGRVAVDKWRPARGRDGVVRPDPAAFIPWHVNFGSCSSPLLAMTK